MSHGKKIFGFLLRGGIAAVVGYCLLVLGADWFAKSQLVQLDPSAEIYFTSDHGESVNAGRWRDPSDEALWFVPEIASGYARAE